MSLDAETVTRYLQNEGVVPADAVARVDTLEGGVSNRVLRVDWGDDAVVVKQPFPNLDVDDDWPADVERVHNEAAAARVFGDVAAEFDIEGVAVPDVLFEDDEHVIAIEAAPRTAWTWKTDLLDGTVSESAAATIGTFLAATHEFAVDDSSLEETFESYGPFEQLRLEPYHETVAKRHPDVAAQIRAEIRRLRESRSTLVHGDYSPKNVLVDRTGAKTTLWFLDFEVAHWGDRVFDIAFMLNHLFIKAVFRPELRDKYVSAAESVWTNYQETATVEGSFESDVVSEIGVLMLARVDGKSPVEYVQQAETKDKLRSLGKRALRAEGATFEEFIETVRSGGEYQ